MIIKTPPLLEYDMIVDKWKSRDMVAKFLGIYSSRRFYSDWTMAVPIEKGRMSATWLDFKQAMHNYYKPTENLTLKNLKT